jgi:hypothetical protein
MAYLKETFRGFPGILDESSLGSAAVQGSSPSLQENKYNTLNHRQLITDLSLKKIRGVLGNKCAGQHKLKTVEIREMM